LTRARRSLMSEEERLAEMALELEGVTQALNEMTARCTGLEASVRDLAEKAEVERRARHTVEEQYGKVMERREWAEERAAVLERAVQPVVSLCAQIAPAVVGALEAYEVRYMASVGVRRALAEDSGMPWSVVVHGVPCADAETCLVCKALMP
jgi:hypothetical protein